MNISLINDLREKTGCGIEECKKAIGKCDNDINTAYEYLRIKGMAVARYKIVNGEKVKFNDDDMIQLAKETVACSFDR